MKKHGKSSSPPETLPTETDVLPQDLLDQVMKKVDRKLAELPTFSPFVQSNVKKTQSHHRSNPEYQIPLDIKIHQQERIQKYQEVGELLNWEHVLCAVEHSAELLIPKSKKNNLDPVGSRVFDEEGEGREAKEGFLDEEEEEKGDERLESLFFQSLNSGNDENLEIKQKSLEVTPLLPPLHLTPTVVQRIRSRLLALFGLSRDVIPSGRSDSSLYHDYDYYSPGYPQSS